MGRSSPHICVRIKDMQIYLTITSLSRHFLRLSDHWLPMPEQLCNFSCKSPCQLCQFSCKSPCPCELDMLHRLQGGLFYASEGICPLFVWEWVTKTKPPEKAGRSSWVKNYSRYCYSGILRINSAFPHTFWKTQTKLICIFRNIQNLLFAGVVLKLMLGTSLAASLEP